MRLLILGLFISAFAYADVNNANIGFGASVPKDGGTSAVEANGPSRAKGGERFTIQFRNYKTVTKIRLTASSKSKQGKILIHDAVGTVTYGDGTSAQTTFTGLTEFDKVTSGNPDKYETNFVMLQDSHYVEVTPNAPFNQIYITVEGFTNNDIGMLLQLEASDGLPIEDFLISRTGNSEIAGAYINEADYANFKSGQLSALIQNGTNPMIETLAGHSYVCSGYVKNNPAQVDYKTRQYFNNNGALQSASNLDSSLVTWVMTEEGWTMGVDQHNGCGTYQTMNILHITPEGNLVSEVDLDRYNYLTLCSNAGYDWNAQDAQLTSETYPSVISPTIYRTNSYEFCRPASVP